jgi:hypothetical protein
MKTITSKVAAYAVANEILKIVNAFGEITWNHITFEKVDGCKIRVTGSSWNYQSEMNAMMNEMYPSALADLVLYPERRMINDVIRTHFQGNAHAAQRVADKLEAWRDQIKQR